MAHPGHTSILALAALLSVPALAARPSTEPVTLAVTGIQAGRASGEIGQVVTDSLRRAGFHAATPAVTQGLIGPERTQAWIKCGFELDPAVAPCPASPELAGFDLVIVGRLVGTDIELSLLRPGGEKLATRYVTVASKYVRDEQIEKTIAVWAKDIPISVGRRYQAPLPYQKLAIGGLVGGVVFLSAGGLLINDAAFRYGRLTGPVRELETVTAYQQAQIGKRSQALGITSLALGTAFAVSGVTLWMWLPGKELKGAPSPVRVDAAPGGVTVSGVFP